MVAKVRGEVALNQQRMHKFHVERFNLRKLNEVEGKKQYHEISSRFAASENLDTEMDINIPRETVKENNNFSAKDGLDYHKLQKDT
jgi:hypothetical protein